jgi:hypothetical protein
MSTVELLTNPPALPISAASKTALIPASHIPAAASRGDRSVSAALEPASHAHCLWCDRTFTPRMTGGSAQKFCCTGQATILDRSAALDDESDRRGLTLGRLLEGVPRERARCLRGVPLLQRDPPRVSLSCRSYPWVTRTGREPHIPPVKNLTKYHPRSATCRLRGRRPKSPRSESI